MTQGHYRQRMGPALTNDLVIAQGLASAEAEESKGQVDMAWSAVLWCVALARASGCERA